MKLWLCGKPAGSLVLIAVLTIASLSGMGFWLFRSHQSSQALRDNPIARENALPGTNDWQIPPGKGTATQIQAYASATSASPGQHLRFYVSVQVEGTPYSIEIYRLGWYGGLGGRLMMTQAHLIGHAQGYYDDDQHRLIGCSSCRVNTKTGLVEAHWYGSYTLTVPASWTTGIYMAKFVDAAGIQAYVPFDVRGNAQSLYVVVTTDTTSAAYNGWGGYSLYEYNSRQTNHVGRGVKVSFDRPYIEGHGSDRILTFEVAALHWLESQGYDLSYISDIDLHEHPAQLLHHRAYLSIGHDEYWTKEMRDGVEYARDHGVALAFLGANAAYWQMRFEADSLGVPDRTIVCYKVETLNHDLARDPLYGKDNTRVTAEWRDPILARPENALIGIMYSSYTNQRRGFPWQLSSHIPSPLLDNTGLQAGQTYGCDIVGYEWDRVFENGATPQGLHVLATSHTLDETNKPDISNTTYYIASSGAMVFAAGSIYWTAALDSYRVSADNLCSGQSLVVAGIQKLMIRVMDALLVKHRPSS